MEIQLLQDLLQPIHLLQSLDQHEVVAVAVTVAVVVAVVVVY